MSDQQRLGSARQRHVQGARVTFEHLSREQRKRYDTEDSHDPEAEGLNERKLLLMGDGEGAGVVGICHGTLPWRDMQGLASW